MTNPVGRRGANRDGSLVGVEHRRRCVDCGDRGDFPWVEETGELVGWLCEKCERRHRQRAMGWRRRIRRRVLKMLSLPEL
jgi:hypothetical protein